MTPEPSSHPKFALLFDPQTSGGLLAGIPAEEADSCANELRSLGYVASAVMGTVAPRDDRPEIVTLRSG